MNRFVFCAKSERGITFGIIKGLDGRHAREGIQMLFDNAKVKLLHLELFGLNGDIIQAMDFKCDVSPTSTPTVDGS